MTPRVSILLPVYNCERYVRLAVESLLAQTFADFELIVIDDGSTDRSKAILESLATRDARIRLVSRPNTGLTVALNEALALATAPLIARMDGDDVSMPERLAKQVAFMNANPDVVLLGAQIETIDPYGVPLEAPMFPLDHASLERELLTANGWVICHPVAMMRRSAIDRVGGYHAEFNIVEDLELWLRLAEVGRIANVPERLLQYRQHLTSIVKTRFDAQLGLRENVIRQAYARRGITPPEPLPLCPRTLFAPAEQLRRWAWHALKLKNVPAARAHAGRVVRLRPGAWSSWNLLFCALRGR